MRSTRLAKALRPRRPLENRRHEAFCLLFAQNCECFGNGMRAYMASYGIDPHDKNAGKSARVSASKLLKKAIILERISFLLDSVLSDAQADRQLQFLITQFSDFKVKLAAIREYNNLKGRIKQRLGMDFSGLSDQELNEEVQRLQEEITAGEGASVAV